LKKFVTTERMLDVAGVFLVAVFPLVIFGLILVFALVCGLLMIFGRTPARIIILACLAVLVVDIQTDWITTLGLRLLLNSIFFGVLFWFLRRHLSRLIVIVVGLMVLATAVLPGEERVTKAGEPAPRAGDNPDLPFVLHLIIDAFSALFAVKGLGIVEGYYRQLLPIDHLFRRLFLEGLPPDDPELENNLWVYLLDMDKMMEKHSMAPFAHGRILAGAP